MLWLTFDMFYAAVEIRDRPELKDKPVAVGGIGMISHGELRRAEMGRALGHAGLHRPGAVSARSRVRHAQDGARFVRRGVGLDQRLDSHIFAKYERVAGIARAIFAQYDPHFRAYSADEAYIDLTRYLRCRVACGDHASARAMLADEALESGASRLAEAREAARRVEELEPELEALRAAGDDDVIVEVEEDDDDDEPQPTREERIAALEAELARARSVVDDAAGAFEELRGRGIDVSSGDLDVVAQHVKKRLAEISAAVDALPALDFVGNDKAGALAERVLDEMRSSVRDATGGLTLSGGLGPNFRLAKVAADQEEARRPVPRRRGQGGGARVPAGPAVPRLAAFRSRVDGVATRAGAARSAAST